MNIQESIQTVIGAIQQLDIRGTESNLNIMLWVIRTLKEISENVQTQTSEKQTQRKEYDVKTYGGEEK